MVSRTITSQELDRLLATPPETSVLTTTGSEAPVLQLLAAVDRDAQAKLITEQPYEPGDIVFNEGDLGDAMYIIHSGRVAVVRGDLISPVVIGYAGVGEIIGEMALLEDEPRLASVIALEALRLLKISRADFQQMLVTHPTLGMGILRALSTRLRSIDQTRSPGSPVEKRLIHQVSKLQTEKQELLELQRLHQETVDLIIHDLRNPLGVVSTALSMLQMVLPKEIMEANEEIIDLAIVNSEYMKRLIESLLEVAQIEAGETELILEAVAFSEFVQSTVDRMAAFLRRDDVTIQSTIPPDLPAIVIDEEKIERVLTNLIDNAIKYTSKNGRVMIAAELKDKQILVSVTNTGARIPAQDRERIFERFTHSPKRGKPKMRGFGLGLAFCRLAVEAHGGQIWVEPAPEGTGNRFVFSLPLSVQAKSMNSAAM